MVMHLPCMQLYLHRRMLVYACVLQLDSEPQSYSEACECWQCEESDMMHVIVVQILTANDVACELFGFTERSLVGSLLTDVLKTTLCQQAMAAETLLELTGDTLQLSAIVVCVLPVHQTLPSVLCLVQRYTVRPLKYLLQLSPKFYWRLIVHHCLTCSDHREYVY